MTEEKELLTILSKKEYKRLLNYLSKKLGKPKIVKRLSLQCTDYRWDDLDTRIRITNGKAEIIQKVGDWKNYLRNEISIELPPDPKVIFNIYQIFRNMMRGQKVLTPIMQYENRLFLTKDFEIKLSRQFGKKEVYNCEIEVTDSRVDLEDLVKKYNIPIKPPGQTQDFWEKWNKTVNLSADELSEKELFEIIRKYLY